MNKSNYLSLTPIFLCLLTVFIYWKKDYNYKALVQENMMRILAQQNYNSKAIFTDLINITNNQEVIAIINLNRQKFAYWQIIRNKQDKTKNQ